MQPEMKIATLFKIFTERYGDMDMKQGQSLQTIAAFWAKSVGRYSMQDIELAAGDYIVNAKKPVWPEIGALMEILRQYDCKPEQPAENVSADWQLAERQAASWYNELVREEPTPRWWLNDRMAALDALLEQHKDTTPGSKLNAFRHTLARAWVKGDLEPMAWNRWKEAWMDAALKRTENYFAEIKARGAARTHERRATAKKAELQWGGQR